VPRDAVMVTAIDAHPSTLTWIAAVHGHRVRSLGVSKFGQSGDIVDLYDYYCLDSKAMVNGAKDLLKAY
jgi:pyruvate dehydrogenase E1 component